MLPEASRSQTHDKIDCKKLDLLTKTKVVFLEDDWQVLWGTYFYEEGHKNEKLVFSTLVTFHKVAGSVPTFQHFVPFKFYILHFVSKLNRVSKAHVTDEFTTFQTFT